MDLQNQTIAELVSQDYRKASVFKRFGLDFCCGGKRPVSEACKRKGINVEKLTKELQLAEQSEKTSTQHYDQWDPDFLADYIVQNHHRYTRQKLPELSAYTKKVAKVHGKANPETVEIRDIFQHLQVELQMHMQKEEQILFPYIDQLVEAQKANLRPEAIAIGEIEQPIRMMEQEHDEAGEVMKKIRQLSNDYQPPAHSCNTYQVLYANLHDLEMDLHKHIHLENNILFPEARQLEQEIKQNA